MTDREEHAALEGARIAQKILAVLASEPQMNPIMFIATISTVVGSVMLQKPPPADLQADVREMLMTAIGLGFDMGCAGITSKETKQ